ncbi:MAG TPA: tail fiber protein [Baekduia sp.]|uniref:phage tail protein n=1 Tax=Baekduia sp. TaxID=2600305 RepID=UPI002D76CE96|nr:tail fiber protein [Baekduia sp.]HET6509766.1 tail fiber protein [Baekduia sp.]
MAQPFLGELRLMSFNFPPKGWALCNGAALAINQNQALFSLLGTMYGGNGQTTFMLPDLRGRVPVHAGNGWSQGTFAGTDAHTLNVSELPAHGHALQLSASDADSTVPTGHVLAATNNGYAPGSQNRTTLVAGTVAASGSGQAHENRPPFLTLSWCIATLGIYPSVN